MICPICNTTVRAGSPSCPSCGADLASQCAGVAPEGPVICPICNTTVSDGSPSCPSCGADLASQCAGVAPEFIFCEGCGARVSPQDRTCPKCGRPAPGILSEDSASSDLAAGKTASYPRLTCEGCGARVSPQDRTCPKCGRPAPGILSEDSASSDLAAGKTASYPRLTAEMIAGSLPVPTGASAPDPSAAPFDQDATSVLDAGAMASAGAGGARGGSARSSVRKAMPHDDAAATGDADPYARPQFPARAHRRIRPGSLCRAVRPGRDERARRGRDGIRRCRRRYWRVRALFRAQGHASR